VSAEGISGISKALESQHGIQQGLVTLDLSNNLLDDAAAKLLAAGLTVNGRLSTLNLAYNRIGNAGAGLISEAAVHAPSLTSLSMSHNKIRGTRRLPIRELAPKICTKNGPCKIRGTQISTRAKKRCCTILARSLTFWGVHVHRHGWAQCVWLDP
jgi:hypothetical protein